MAPVWPPSQSVPAKAVDEAPCVDGNTGAEQLTQLAMVVGKYISSVPPRRIELYCDKVLVATLLTENISLQYAFPYAVCQSILYLTDLHKRTQSFWLS